MIDVKGSRAPPPTEGGAVLYQALEGLARAVTAIRVRLGDDILDRGAGIPADLLGLRFEATRRAALQIPTIAELFATCVIRDRGRPEGRRRRRLETRIGALEAESDRLLREAAPDSEFTVERIVSDYESSLFGDVQEVVEERGIEKFGTWVVFERREGGSQIAFWAEKVCPEFGQILRLKRLFKRLEVFVVGNRLLEYERRACRWWFARYTAPGDVQRYWKAEAGFRNREQEFSLVDRPTLATGRTVIDGILEGRMTHILAMPPGQRRLASALRAARPGVYQVRERGTPGPLWESAADSVYERLYDGRTFRVREYDPDVTGRAGRFAFGRLLPFADGAYLPLPGMSFFTGEDEAMEKLASRLSERLVEWDDEKEDLAPSIVLEATTTPVFVANARASGGPVRVPRDVPPAPSKRAARELLKEFRTCLQEDAPDDLRDEDDPSGKAVWVDRVVLAWIAALERQAEGDGDGDARDC